MDAGCQWFPRLLSPTACRTFIVGHFQHHCQGAASASGRRLQVWFGALASLPVICIGSLPSHPQQTESMWRLCSQCRYSSPFNQTAILKLLTGTDWRSGMLLSFWHWALLEEFIPRLELPIGSKLIYHLPGWATLSCFFIPFCDVKAWPRPIDSSGVRYVAPALCG